MPARPSDRQSRTDYEPKHKINKTFRGRDSFGTLIIHANVDCNNCLQEVNFGVRYRKGTDHFPGDIVTPPDGWNTSNLIIRHMIPEFNHHLGITCGCYAKAHRQVAHVVDAMKHAKSSS